ncbi:AAA+ ATPase superfamily predicted ATPase [Allocatelliglobosispora scoriae]|uniref:AAA+ ATPase superfamily predicted ATPase n=1 Tax=Allocatelliglobosispora scoriae TaxID=643052 RepID=A0A841BS16_9ACTN|nr:ATP-binding protein [Allocatelliglobosispora scoriae]MBB5869590.1 AAA+ ATPase superfamily predicted ATPase [Allocatelliglobosispora scoriae]
MADFIGRQRELSSLTQSLDEVRAAVAAERPGQCLMLRGRRRIGKSALVEAFLEASGAPYVFHTAEIGTGGDPLLAFTESVSSSSLPEAAVFSESTPGNWNAALRQLASILPEDQASVVVIDELPYLMDESGSFESVLQRAWDRELSRKPVLLILVGSDLAMMEALTSYGRPFHQRGMEMPIGPLNPADVAAMTGLDAAEAFDAALITGGLPIVCARWKHGEGIWSFLARELANPVSPLLVSAQLSLAAEFPEQAQARAVLSAIGSGERTFTNIARAAGGIAHTTLTRAAELLVAKRVIVGDLPISLQVSKERRYRITDPYLRFWFTFLGPHLAEIDRLRSDLTLARIRDGWTGWRGRAIEPLAREALARLLPAHGIRAAPAVGGFWTRSNDIEIDIVGADRPAIAKELLFLGSIKWLEHSSFDNHDLASLQQHRARITAEPLPLLAVTRSGSTARNLDAVFGPTDLLSAWQA